MRWLAFSTSMTMSASALPPSDSTTIAVAATASPEERDIGISPAMRKNRNRDIRSRSSDPVVNTASRDWLIFSTMTGRRVNFAGAVTRKVADDGNSDRDKSARRGSDRRADCCGAGFRRLPCDEWRGDRAGEGNRAAETTASTCQARGPEDPRQGAIRAAAAPGTGDALAHHRVLRQGLSRRRGRAADQWPHLAGDAALAQP